MQYINTAIRIKATPPPTPAAIITRGGPCEEVCAAAAVTVVCMVVVAATAVIEASVVVTADAPLVGVGDIVVDRSVGTVSCRLLESPQSCPSKVTVRAPVSTWIGSPHPQTVYPASSLCNYGKNYYPHSLHLGTPYNN